MVDFVQLQHIMKEQLDQDRAINIIEVQGPTLEDAVSQAATMLNCSIRRLEYEVTERGFTGFMGAGKKTWTIKAYQRIVERKLADLGESGDGGVDAVAAAPVIEDKNGYVFVQLRHAGVFIKVSQSIGRGKKVTNGQVKVALAERNIHEYDQGIASEAVKAADGEYVRIGDFQHNLANDASMTVEITEEEMKALLYVNPPGPGGCDISLETYQTFLKNNKVYHGIDLDFLTNFADSPVYKERVVVARGTPPVNGRDAYIQYNFENDHKARMKEGANGRVDFKDLNIIQNVVEAQPLAKKIPPELGTAGRTVTGNPLPAKDGKDIPIPLGKNVHLGDDKVTIISDMNGQVVEVGGKINVEPVYTVEGNVDLKTGNIIFLGTVIVKGSVEDGFSVKAAGNIEVNGTVEKAELDAEGDIIVHQGITGSKANGIIRAGKSIWARFIENTALEAGDMVVAQDGIINSRVDAFKRILCQGKRATIVGGRLRASEEINAKVLGSPTAGTETICEVGIDPKTKEQLAMLIENKVNLGKQLDDIKLNMQTLVNIKKQRKSLPEDKEAYLKELDDKRLETMRDIQKNNEAIAKAQDFLANLQTRGRVSASTKVYPGVRVIIKDAKEDIRNEYKAVTFILEDGLVRASAYEEPAADAMKAPDGFAAN
jgi:uncharacterized protein (DUF342 family)